MESVSVLEALDITIAKFKCWVPATMKELGAQEYDIQRVKEAMARDALLFVPFMKDFITAHKEAFDRRDVSYFQLLLPLEYQKSEIPSHISDKGFLYFEILESLLNDLQ